MSVLLLTGCSFLPAKTPVTLPQKTPLVALKAHAKVTVGGRKVKAVLFLKQPDRVRAEFFGPLNELITVFVGNSKDCLFYSEGEVRECREGTPFFAYHGRPGEYVPIFFATHEPYKNEAGWRVFLNENGNISKVEKVSNDFIVTTVRAGDYREEDGRTIPFSVTFENAEKTVSIEYNSVEINPKEILEDNGLFTLPMGIR